MKHFYSLFRGNLRHVLPLLLVVNLLPFSNVIQAQTQDFSSRQDRLKQHINYLAADSLKGRRAGSDDSRKAARYIIEQFTNIGLKPLYKDWMVPFGAPLSDTDSPLEYRNVVALIEGSDSVLKYEYIILGAHYDHLGVKDGTVYNGADDNASGTAAIIETARILNEHRNELKRSVIIVAFDAEEIGLYGSTAFAEKLWIMHDFDNDLVPILAHSMLEPINNVKMMMSIDMVGWLKESKELSLSGTGTMKNSKELLTEIAKQIDIPINTNRYETSIFTATDTEPFAKYGVPTLAVTTGTKSPYHKPQDDANLIDYEGLDRVVQYIAQVTLTMAKQPNLTSTGRVAPKHTQHRSFFELGASVSYGYDQLYFREAKCMGAYKPGVQAGFNGHFNLRNMAIQIDCYFDHISTVYPDVTLTTSHSYQQNSLMVPIMLCLQSKDMSQLYIGAGPYYAHLFNAANNIKPDQYGLQIGVGMRIGQFSLNYACQYQLNGIYFTPGSLHVNNRGVSWSLAYYFW